MPTMLAPLLSFNRGQISKTTLARTDLDRTRLSAEVMTNFLPKTQGPMILRPGTKYVGSSIRDTGAAWIEFVASTTDVALLELTEQNMRVWLPSDTGNDWETPVQPGMLVPLARPSVSATVDVEDTGWYEDSLGGYDLPSPNTPVRIVSGILRLNAGAIGSLARTKKRVVVAGADQNKEHALRIKIGVGNVIIRVGSSDGADDYVGETALGTGWHSLAFTPSGDFFITLQNPIRVTKTVESIAVEDTGTVELFAQWGADEIDSVRYDQSADIVYANSDGEEPYKIERRGTGRSWSVVKYEPENGPFLAGRTSSAKLSVDGSTGNTAIRSDIPFFTSGMVRGLMQITHEGQNTEAVLGIKEASTPTVTMTGIGDTGRNDANSERRIVFAVSGTYTGRVAIERSFDDPDFGFKTVVVDYVTSGSASDTGTFTTTIHDEDDNISVFYRARMIEYTSGAAVVKVTYKNGSTTGTARITSFTSNIEVDAEVISPFSDTGSTDNWVEGSWSERRGYPTAVALHEGRLCHAGQANFWASVSDDYENFDAFVEGEAGPLNRTLGSGPVDGVQFMLSLLRLIVGTSGSEIGIKASSLDETLTPTNAAATAFSTQGSATLRAVKLDNKGLFVQRSGTRLYMIGFGSSAESYNDYDSTELTILTPDILKPGVVSIAIQRQPDTRIHCALSDGTVAILTYEPKEEVLAWSKWVTDTGTDSAVERVMVLPGSEEDQVFYHIRRTINGQTKRFLEKWAQESECRGDTGLSWLADCAVSYTDTGAATVITDFAEHLGGQTLVAWANDTGQDNSVGKDLTPDDTGGAQQLLSVDTGGDLTLTDSGWKHVVGGLPYRADYKSTKLAYAVRGATAMTHMKRVDRLALILEQTHNNALFMGGDTGHLDPLPRVTDEGEVVDANKIFPEYDKFGHAFNGEWDEDSRLHVRAKAPRPATVMALLPRVTTNE